MKRIGRNFIWAAFIVLAIPTVVVGATIQVPLDFPTIFEAILAAEDGDTVLVAPGTYPELPIHFLGKAITVTSTGGPEATIIEGNGMSVVSFIHGEGPDTILDGFTISKGSRDSWGGGGIFCWKSSPTIQNNIITENSALMGGGIYCELSSPKIENNKITKNKAVFGGGIYCCRNSHGEILKNEIRLNKGTNADDTDLSGGGGIYCDTNSYPIINCNILIDNLGDLGGGISCANYAWPKITNNIIFSNDGKNGGGIYCHKSFPDIINNTLYQNTASDVGGGISLYQSDPEIANTILWDNTAPSWTGHLRFEEIYFQSVLSGPNINYCNITGGWALGVGNIEMDPLFANPAAEDFHLNVGSLCIDAGDNSAASLPDTDYEGDDRIADGDNDGTAVVDMGADERLPGLRERAGGKSK